MNILSLNIRAVGEAHKRLCLEQKVNFLGLQETMTGKLCNFVIQSMWHNSCFDFVYEKSEGKSGGIVAIWDTNFFSLSTTLEGDGYLDLLGNWKNIQEVSLNHLLGDFNEVRNESERKGTIFDPRAFASVLINGSATEEFKLERGLRQGDPLSPFLLILAAEALNVAILEATNHNIFHGIKVEKDKLHISHLQYADDALILGEWSLTNAKNLSRILTCFHLASGLKVNFNKSKLYGIGVSNLELNSIATSIGCLASQFPCTYLGLPIGTDMS
nr:RNA-directed DNA polymerase, eukaryota, reverse transcriptase zinc-binding domain protein [Tanacetum cinerariifolium]